MHMKMLIIILLISCMDFSNQWVPAPDPFADDCIMQEAPDPFADDWIVEEAPDPLEDEWVIEEAPDPFAE